MCTFNLKEIVAAPLQLIATQAQLLFCLLVQL